jgi:hypothetical protein
MRDKSVNINYRNTFGFKHIEVSYDFTAQGYSKLEPPDPYILK